jgi:hypothetical protein
MGQHAPAYGKSSSAEVPVDAHVQSLVHVSGTWRKVVAQAFHFLPEGRANNAASSFLHSQQIAYACCDTYLHMSTHA